MPSLTLRLLSTTVSEISFVYNWPLEKENKKPGREYQSIPLRYWSFQEFSKYVGI